MKAMELSPDEAIFPLQLGSIYYKLKNSKEAYENWGLAYKLDPTLPEFKSIPKKVLYQIKAKSKTL